MTLATIDSAQQQGSSTPGQPYLSVPGRAQQQPPQIKKQISLATVERSIAAKMFFEQYFDRLNKAGMSGRLKRRAMLEAELDSLGVPDAEKRQIRKDWIVRETDHMRLSRDRITLSDFEMLKTLGHGAFGVVKLVREKATGEIFAMKILKKSIMLKRRQESHVRAERDLLCEAAEIADWIVQLYYTFQDDDHLYFVMEYMSGGDLLGLLIKKDIFEEEFAKFYAAEMILCIEEAHKLGMVSAIMSNWFYSNSQQLICITTNHRSTAISNPTTFYSQAKAISNSAISV